MNSFFTFLFLLVVLILLIKSGAVLYMKDAFIMLMDLIEIIFKSTIGLLQEQPYQMTDFQDLYGLVFKNLV